MKKYYINPTIEVIDRLSTTILAGSVDPGSETGGQTIPSGGSGDDDDNMAKFGFDFDDEE